MTRLKHASALPILLLVMGCPTPSGGDDSDTGIAESCDTADTAATGTLVMNIGFEPGDPYEDLARLEFDGEQQLWVWTFGSPPESCYESTNRDLAYTSHPTPDTSECTSITNSWACIYFDRTFGDPDDPDYKISCSFMSDPTYIERCDTVTVDVLLSCSRSGPYEEG